MEPARLTVENIGGIESAEAELPPGVTVLAGPNASNKTSFLQAVMAGLGSDQISLKADADEGRVELDLHGETYERTFTRTGSGVSVSGDRYLDDPELADLFAFLLKSNEARRAVEAGADLRELIMRPVDTDAIQSEIERLQEEKSRLDDELSEVQSLKQRLPDLEQRKQSIEDDIESTREELEAAEEELDDVDASVEDRREEKDELEEKLSELSEVRSELEDVRYDIETKRESRDSLQEERRELEEREEDLDAVPEAELETLEDHIDDLRRQKQSLDAEISELQNTIRFNEKMIDDAREGTHPAIQTAPDGGEEGALTDRLLEENQETVCWTCGSEVDIDRIEDTLQNLRDLRRQKLDDKDDLESELDEYKERKRDYERRRQNVEQVRQRIARTETEIESTESALDRLTDRKGELMDEVERLEAEVEELESETYEEVLDLHRNANELEYELGKLESERDDVVEEIEEIEAEIEREDEIEDRREEIQDELVDLRTKIDRIEENAVEEFNEHMDEVLTILDYENIERIWIEIVEKEVREGRRKVQQNAFELHVVRSSDGGVAYEDTVDHLSESEREVTGLVFALAGYLVHDLHEQVPCMIMDALEPIDSDRIAALVEYFESYVDYLVVALLQEDAEALEVDHHTVADIGA
ncbi:AAA family ATPase [Halostella sp. JP-L12]|uniref:archaea-specific SMC-related protein n=1 Tax=Halostella TaxID=1843185 RepID=UPI000EF7C4E6|nr:MULTISPECIES: archaea-specific SMC-related protein [Halostella]NHN49456.1 AAA family ATPase [Halostella sp. JP-L12]